MTELASPRQLRVAFTRQALICVPAILLLGTLSSRIANPDGGNPWFDALSKPSFMPAPWVFGAVWSVLYVLMALALALILDARRTRERWAAVTLFLIQLGLNLAWSPVFFTTHRIMLAFGLVVATLLWAGATTLAFWRIRSVAGMLMLPCLIWLLFAGMLSWQIHERNPNGVTLVPTRGDTHIIIQ